MSIRVRDKAMELLSRPYVLAGMMAVAGFLLYANTLGHGFVLDDSAVLAGNRYVKQGVDGFGEIFRTGSWSGYDPDRDLRIYRPLQLAVLALQFEGFGMNPTGYHWVQVLSYSLLCGVVCLLLYRMAAAFPGGAWIAAVAAGLFTLHPVHTEVVANIKGNGDLLSMLFSVIALHAVLSCRREMKIHLLLLAALSFLTALFFKETAVTTVGVAGLMLYFFSDRSPVSIGGLLLPMCGCVAVYLWVRSLIFGQDAHSLDQTTTNISNVLLMADGWSQEIGLRLYALGKNLQLTVYPYPLRMMYVYDSIPMVEVIHMEALLPLFLYGSLTFLFFARLRKRDLIGFGLGFFLLTLFLFSNIAVSIPNLVSERWLLMPSLGICLVMACLLKMLFDIHAPAAIGLLGVISIGYGGYTLQRNAAWESELTLARTDIRTSPANYSVLHMMATESHRKAKNGEMSADLLAESAYYYDQVLRLTPNNLATRNTLGLVYEAMGDHDRAVIAFAEVSRHDSALKGRASYSHARNLILAEHFTRALRAVEALEREYPNHSGVIGLRAAAVDGLGKRRQARSLYDRALEMDPTNPEAHRYYAAKYLELANAGNLNETFLRNSARHHEMWLDHFSGERFPARGWNVLGQIYERLNEPENAARAFGQAGKVDSEIQGKALFSQARNLAEIGEHARALEVWLRLEKKYPDNVDLRREKAKTLEALNQHSPGLAIPDSR